MSKRGEITEAEKIEGIFNEYGKISGAKALVVLKNQLGLDRANHANIIFRLDELSRAHKTEEYIGFDLSDVEDKDSAKYLLLHTSVDSRFNTELCMAFKRNSKDDELTWFYASDENRCRAMMTPSATVEDTVDEVENTQEQYEGCFAKMINDIVAASLFRKKYESDGKEKLAEVIKLQKQKVQFELNSCIQKNYIINKDKTRVVMNTGIIDSYGEFIYLMWNTTGKLLTTDRIVSSIDDMRKAGFEQTEVEPIKFYESKDQLIFSGDIEDIDIFAGNGVRHISDERRDRLPDEVANWSSKRLIDALKSSIEFNVKMSKHDTHWILPFYCTSKNEIEYLFPLYLTGDYDGKADAALVVAPFDGKYIIKTVLEVEMAHKNAASIGEPDCIWM